MKSYGESVLVTRAMLLRWLPYQCRRARSVLAWPRYTIPHRRLRRVDAAPVTIERFALPG